MRIVLEIIQYSGLLDWLYFNINLMNINYNDASFDMTCMNNLPFENSRPN